MFDQNDFYRELLDFLTDGVYFTDRERRIIHWNKGAEKLSGFSPGEVIGKCCKDNLLMHVDASGHSLCLNDCPLSETIKDGQPREAEVFLHHKDGHRVPIHIRVTPVRDDGGAIVGAVEVFSDNTAHTQLAERLSQMEQLALLDSLTGLGNRLYFESSLRSRLEEFRRNHWNFGILFVDIDDFKSINDRYGHQAGDRVIQMVGRSLNATSRYFDAVCRWGGDEFVVIVANANIVTLREISGRLRVLVENSVLTEPKFLSVTVSIGGAQAVPDDTMESLVRRADDRLFQAKKSGKNCVRI